MTAALRRLGFDAVFDTNFAADLTIMEEGTELLTRLRRALVENQQVALPMFTSCSPGWILFAEYFHPDMLPNLSTCKSPQQMFGALAKTYYAEKLGLKPEQIFVTSVMPCTAKKYECGRPEMASSGARDVDAVLTTRELGKMIRAAGIDFVHLPDEEMDAPLGLSTGAADIFANTGGVMEAACARPTRSSPAARCPLTTCTSQPVTGLEGVKEAALQIEGTLEPWKFLEGVTLQVAVAHGLSNAYQLAQSVLRGRETVPLHRSDDLPGRLHRRWRTTTLHQRRRAPGSHRRHLPRRRRQNAAQVAREPGHPAAVRGVPRQAAWGTLPSSAAHDLSAPQPGVNGPGAMRD